MGILNKEPHPGLVLQEKINSMHMSRSELAARTGVTEKHISTVINGNKGISPAFAKKLAYAFDEQASVWLNLQAKYDAYCAEIEAENNVSDEEKNILHSLKDVIEYLKLPRSRKWPQALPRIACTICPATKIPFNLPPALGQRPF